MTATDRTFVSVLLWAIVGTGALGLAGVVLLFDGRAPTLDGIRNLWCVVAPLSLTDWFVHALGMGVWVAGGVAVITGVIQGRETWRVGQEFRASVAGARGGVEQHRLRTAMQTANLENKVDLVDADVPFAFVYGWRRPRICLSSGIVRRLSERELEAVLLHERWHQQRRDPIRLAIVQTLTAMVAFVPSARTLILQHRILVEIAADRFVVECMGTPRWLASAMHKLTSAEPVGDVGFVGMLDPRIAALNGERLLEVSNRMPLALLALELGVLVLLARGDSVARFAGLTHPVC